MAITQSGLETILAECEAAGCPTTELQAMELYLLGCSARMMGQALQCSHTWAWQLVTRARSRLVARLERGEAAGGFGSVEEFRRWLAHAVREDVEEIVVRCLQRGDEESYTVLEFWRPATLGH